MAWNQTVATKTASPARMTAWQLFMRRRRFVISPSLQLPLLLHSFAHLVLVSVALIAALFGPSIVSLLRNEATSDRALSAANQILFLHPRFWPTLALALLLVALDSIRTSHRIAGPIYRFNQALERVQAARIPEPIQLRREDFLQEDCRRINAALELTRTHIGDVGDAARALAEAIEAARGKSPQCPPEETERLLQALMDRSGRLVELSRRFELDERRSKP